MVEKTRESLADVALELVSGGRGILAADESPRTMSSRLEAEDIPPTAHNRHRYRMLLVDAPGLSDTVSGVILCDETVRENFADRVPFAAACRLRGILPGVKVDTGVSALAGAGGATITEGLDGLRGRLAEYAAMGVAFAKWRAVISVETVSPYALSANAHALARYAALCQEQGLVPIVEPEVLCDGNHSITESAKVTDQALAAVFAALDSQGVDLNGIVLKPNMVTPGLAAPASSPATVADATLQVLKRQVPPSVPGIAFLSGGQSNSDACANLGAMNQVAGQLAPWQLTYSFGRALVSDALRVWGGAESQVPMAQQVLLTNCARAASAVGQRAAVA